MTTLFVLAQTYWKKEDPKQLTYGLIVLGALLLLLFIYQLAKQGLGGSAGLSGSKAGFSKGAFRRNARLAGMAEDEIRFLEEYGRNLGVSNPEFLFANGAKLEAFIKDIYRTIEKESLSEHDAEERKAMLFGISERLARRSTEEHPVRSTRQLGKNTPLSFLTPQEESYPTVIVQSEAGGIAVEPVLDPYGAPIRFRRGTKLVCYFYTKSHQGYQFSTRVGGWQRLGDKELMILQHSDGVSALPSRAHQRREMKTPCSFYRVAVKTQQVKGKAKAGARVETIAYPGTIIDISAGGAGIQCANPLNAGEFLKLEFDPGTGSLAAFAKVLRTNRFSARGGVMHVQFVKISQKSLNAILAFVHGYAE